MNGAPNCNELTAFCEAPQRRSLTRPLESLEIAVRLGANLKSISWRRLFPFMKRQLLELGLFPLMEKQ